MKEAKGETKSRQGRQLRIKNCSGSAEEATR